MRVLAPPIGVRAPPDAHTHAPDTRRRGRCKSRGVPSEEARQHQASPALRPSLADSVAHAPPH
eukprot:5221505-Alexandrium_andersonii.AAC.1